MDELCVVSTVDKVVSQVDSNEFIDDVALGGAVIVPEMLLEEVCVTASDVVVDEDVDVAFDVRGADEVVLRDVLVVLEVLSDGSLFVLEEVTLEFTVLVRVVDCDLAVLALVVMESSEVRSPLVERREEVVCREAELWLDDERREPIAVWLEVEEVLKPDVVGSMLTDSTKDGVNDEVTELAALWDLELKVSALLEYLEEDTGKTLLDCAARRLEEVEVARGLGDDCSVADVVVGTRLAGAEVDVKRLTDAGVEIERLVEKAEAD